MKEEKSIVRVSNILNLTRQEFTLIEKQMYLATLLYLKEKQGFNIDLENDSPVRVEFSATTLKETNRERIKLALDKITSRKIYFDNSNSKSDYFGFVVPFISAKYESKDRSYSNVVLKLNPDCKKLFFELANGYTELDLQAILNLTSPYSIRMYELLSQYKNKKSWTIEVDALKGLLGFGILEYKNYRMFEKRVLEYSQKELLEHCGIYFSWEIAAKQRKKITALTFHITTKEKQEKIELDNEIKQTVDYINNLKPFEIAQKIHMASTKYTLKPEQIDYITSNNKVFNEFIRIDLIIEAMIEKQKPPKDRTKYLAKSLGLDKVKFK
jgi:plasmid replication initiation protein